MANDAPKSIFISYRRQDSAGHAGRLYDHLKEHLPDTNIFFDTGSIRPGEGWREVIELQASSCDVMLVVIGPRWLSISEAYGRRRLDNPEDVVRLEVKTGLEERTVRIVPILVGEAEFPGFDGLPEDLQDLAGYNAFRLSDESFAEDIVRLANALRLHLYTEDTQVEVFKPSGIVIPDSWDSVPLGEMANIQTPRRAGVQNLGIGVYPYYKPSGIVEYVDAYNYDGDYILISSMLTTATRSVVYRTRGKVTINPNMNVVDIQSPNILIDYLWYYLSTFDFQSMELISAGSAFLRITKRDVQNTPIKLPPIDMQRNIVSFIELQMTDIEQKRDELNQQLAGLESQQEDVYRRAFSGEL